MKRNQIMITALAIMIAIAGYLNFAGNKISEETLVLSDEVPTEEMTALLDISEEDIASDIESLDEEAVITENYLDTEMQEGEILSEIEIDTTANTEEEIEEVAAVPKEGEALASLEEESVEGIPGEAVFTSSQALSTLSGARLLKEQTRAKNKETLLAIMNSTTLEEEQKLEAVSDVIALTDRSEKEMEAEILLSAKGFDNAVVSMSETSVDVVVGTNTLSDAQLAQIMDIVSRKTEISAENIIISQVSGN